MHRMKLEWLHTFITTQISEAMQMGLKVEGQ